MVKIDKEYLSHPCILSWLKFWVYSVRFSYFFNYFIEMSFVIEYRLGKDKIRWDGAISYLFIFKTFVALEMERNRTIYI